MGTPSSMNEARQFLDTDANNGVCFVKKSSQFEVTDDLSCYNEGPRSSEKIIKQIVMVSDFGLSGSHKIPEPLFLDDFTIEDNKMGRKNFKGKKRAKGADSKEQNDFSNHLVKSPLERDVKIQRTESPLVHNSNKSDVKKAEEINKEKEEEDDDDDSKHGYVHIRAKRGKATNSHSLAERLRREKISERMRILQDLVPGCNKITGKAVMLDEIINYVQSLQQQVELLSMKLAAVNPELNFDIEQNSYRDILWLSPGLSPSYTFYPGTAQIPSEMSMAAAIPQLSSIAQIENQWDDELQNAIQMSFIPPQPAINSEFHDKVSRKA